MPTYSERLKELRAKKGMTQNDLHEKSGIPLGTLRNHEQDIRSISSDDLFAYCRSLGVACSEFEDCAQKKTPTVKKPKPKGK